MLLRSSYKQPKESKENSSQHAENRCITEIKYILKIWFSALMDVKFRES